MTVLSVRAGLDRRWFGRVLRGAKGYGAPRRKTLIRIAAAMELSGSERSTLESAAGLKAGELQVREPTPVVESALTLRRALVLVRAPADALRVLQRVFPLARSQQAAVRCTTVFGDRDVVIRLTTSKGNVLSFVDALHATHCGIDSTETILIRDDLDDCLTSTFPPTDLPEGWVWAVVFVLARKASPPPKRSDPTSDTGDLVRAFKRTAHSENVRNSVVLLSAAMTIGRYDAVAELYARRAETIPAFLTELGTHTHQYPALETFTYLGPVPVSPKEFQSSPAPGEEW